MRTNAGKCKQKVTSMNGWHTYGCQRSAWKDGFCKQHHPDTVAERRKKSDARWEKKQENSPWALLAKANERIQQLEKEIADLKISLSEADERIGELQK